MAEPRRRRPSNAFTRYGLDEAPDDLTAIEPYEYPTGRGGRGGGEAAAPQEEGPNPSTFVSGIKRGFGGMVANTARTAEDVGLPARGMREYGEQLEKDNPADVVNLGDIAKHPIQFLRETGGELAPQFAGSMAGARLGAMAGAPFEGVGAIPGAVIGGVIGAFAPSAVQSYGGQLRNQDETGDYNRPRAGLAALASAGLDTVGPVDMLARKLVTTGAKKTGLGTATAVGLKGAGEFGTEYGQEVVEDYGATGTVYSPGASEGYLMAGLKGGVGGTVAGYVEEKFGREKEDKTQTLPEDKVAPDAAGPALLEGPTNMLALPAPTAKVEGPKPQLLLTGPPEGGATRGGQEARPALPGQRPTSGRASQVYGPAIAAIESRGSGDYKARGPVLRNGDQALGRYQIMRSNLPTWTRKTFGREVSEQDFLSDPDIQDRVFDKIFGDDVQKHGAANAANIWFTGKKIGQDSGRGDVLGTKPNEYVAKFLENMKGVDTDFAAGEGGGAAAPGGESLGPVVTAEEMLARINETSQVPGKALDPLKQKLATAVANDDEATVQSELGKWQEAERKLGEDEDAGRPIPKGRADRLQRQQRVLTAAMQTLTQLRKSRADLAGQPAAQPDAPPIPEMETAAAVEPDAPLAQAGEQMVADGALDRQTAQAAPQPQPMDEASAASIAKTRASALDQIIKNPIIPDPRAAFMSILDGDPQPLTAAEDYALNTAAKLRLLAPAQEQARAAEPAAPKPAAEPKPTKAATETAPTPSPAPAAQPAPPADPLAETIRERVKGYAAAFGKNQKTAIYQGVNAALGDTTVEAPPEGSDRATWFELGQKFVAKQRDRLTKTADELDEDTPAEKPAKAPVEKQPKKARAQKAAKASKEKAPPKKRGRPPKAKVETATDAPKRKPGRPKGSQTDATKRAIQARKPKAEPPPPKPLTDEEKAAAKLKADYDAFEVKTERAVKDGDISPFQRQNLDKVASTVSVETAEKLFDAEVARYARVMDADLGKGDTIAEMLARAEQETAVAASPPQTKTNVVPPAKPVQGVKVGEAPPLTETVEKLRPLLTLEEKGRVARAYGHSFFGEKTLVKFAQDFVSYVNGVREGISKSVQAVAKRVQATALAAMIVFNPAGLTHPANYTPAPTPVTSTRTVEVTTEVPASAKGKLSERATRVYETQAAKAIKNGKFFVISDKPEGVMHVFDSKGEYVASGNTLYGSQAGDVLPASRLNDLTRDPDNFKASEKITPAGTYQMRVGKQADYLGGKVFWLVDPDSSAYTVAMHAVYKGNPSENRQGRLASKTAGDNKISFGCINTSDEFFLKQLLAHEADLQEGLIFVLPDVVANTDATFPAETKTVTEKAPAREQPKAPDNAPPGLPPERTRPALQAQRRPGRKRFDMAANRARIDKAMAERLGKAAPLPELEPGFVEPKPTWPKEPGARIVATQRKLSQMNRDGQQNTAEYRETLEVNEAAKAELAPETMTPDEVAEYERALGAANTELRAQLNALGLQDVAAKVISKVELALRFGTGKRGVHDPVRNLIFTALENPDRRQTSYHEAGHALRTLDLFTPQEWKVMSAFAKSEGLIDQTKAALPRAEDGTVEEEAIVEAWARWAADEDLNPPNAVVRLFEKLGDFMEAIRNAFQGNGFQSGRDVFRRTYSGEVGARARGEERQGARNYKGTVKAGQESFAQTEAQVRNRPEAKARRKEVDRAASALNLSARDAASKMILMLTDTESVADMAAKLGIKSAKTFVELHSRGHALARKFQGRLVNIRDRTRALPARFQGSEGIVSKFLYDSVRAGKWGFEPTADLGFPASWTTKNDKGKTKAEIDPALAARFAEIERTSPEAAKIIKDVFKFNHDARAQLHKATLTAINAEFDPIIKDEDEEFTEEARAEAQDAKDRAIKYHSRVFNTQEGLPYSPLKRSGAWAIVGKSDAYMAAVKAKDHELIDKMRSDPKHYFVDFRETAWEADKVRAYVQGKFGKENSYVFERGKSDQRAVSGVELLVAFKRMQAAMAVAGVGNKASAKMEQMARDFYLHTLSDESARKAELNRENVPGETMDMMEAFFSRGNATAEYAASIQNNVEMQKSLRDMQEETSNTSAVTRTTAQRFMNELMWRYEHNLSTQPNRTVDKIVKATSLWMLLTSPFYYVQNASQAVLISHPTMVARFGTRATRELITAYTDFSKMTKGTGWLDAVDYEKHPDPKIAAMLVRLAERGRLDSGVTVEDNAAFINGDGILPQSWNRVDKFFRMMPQRIEVQNRVVTGIATYRSALASGLDPEAAFEAASEMIRSTHGDYSGFISPRIFNQFGQFGKIAGQFRKFQLIMGAHVVSEFKKMIFGATPAEKWMAAKSLAFLSAHLAAVGGIVGQPGAALLGPLIGALMNALDDDDDKDWSDWRQSLREELGAGKEKDRNILADFLFKGAPYALLQMDTSDRMGMGNMLSLAPYSGIEEAGTDKEKWYAVMGKAMLGPSGKLVANAVNGLDWGINHDDWGRFAESVAPTFGTNLLKAERLRREGLTDKSGTTLFQPEDIKDYEQALTIMGVNPRKLANQGEKTSERFKAEEYYSNKTSSMKRDYVKAFEAKDARQLQEVRTEWKAIQAARKRDGFKQQPLGELLKAPREMAKKNRRVKEGVAYTPATKEFVMRQMMANDALDAAED